MGRRGALIAVCLVIAGAIAGKFLSSKVSSPAAVVPQARQGTVAAQRGASRSQETLRSKGLEVRRESTGDASGWSVMGLAVTGEGAPVESVEVVLRLKEGREIARVLTGPDGGFTVAGAAPGAEVELDLDAPGAAWRRLHGKLPERPEESRGDSPSKVVDLGRVAIGEACDLLVLLRGPGGEPVKGNVTIRSALLFEASPEGYWSERERPLEGTAEEGAYRLGHLPADGAHIEVQAAGYAPFWRLIRLPYRLPLVLDLERAETIRGVVVGQDGVPLPGVEVRLNSERAGGRGRGESTTDAGGRFEVTDLPGGLYRLYTHRMGYAKREMESIPAGTLDLVVELEREPPAALEVASPGEPGGAPPSPEAQAAVVEDRRTGGIRGTVVDSEGRPVPRASVFCEREKWSHERAQWHSDDQGRFEARPFFPARYPFTVHAEGYSRTQIDIVVEDHKTTEVQIELLPEGRIAGRVLAGGVPAPGARLSACPAEDMEKTVAWDDSDGEGRYVLRGLPAGTYFVVGKLPRMISRMKPGIIVESGKTTEVPDLRLEEVPHDEVSGRVVDEEGRPVPGAWVHLTVDHDDEPGDTSDAEGRFRITGLPAREFRVLARKPGFYFPSLMVNVPGPEQKLVLKNLHGFSGRVLDAGTGSPVAGAKIDVINEWEHDAGRCFWWDGYIDRTISDAQGRFSFGVFHHRNEIRFLVVRADEYAVAFARVQEKAGGEEWVVPLDRGIAFEARVVDERGQPIPDAEACLVNPETGFHRAGLKVKSDGSLVCPGTREGRYRVLLRQRNHGVEEVPVEVSAGAAPSVLILKGSGALTVRVRNADGTVPARAVISITDEKGGDALGLSRAFERGGIIIHFVLDGGSRTYDHLPRGRYRLQAKVGEAVSPEVELALGRDPAEVTLTLP